VELRVRRAAAGAGREGDRRLTVTADPAPSVAARRERFQELHRSGCFVMPNPWDLGSARYLVTLGFPALATTSAGFAWARGRPDNAVPLESVLHHLGEMAGGVPVPVNADFEGGFAVAPEVIAANVGRAVATGVAGVSIEDSTGDPARPLFDFDLAVARVRAACRAVAGSGVVLTARSEGFISGRPDLAETVRRLTAYAEVGAGCLYAPGIRTREEITAVVRAAGPRPVNVLARGTYTTVAELAALGVRRISVGAALARTAWKGLMDAAVEIAEHGTFEHLEAAAQIPIQELFPSG
jgi:2-methylisocitrate lyase-like PEP mutase family enzyme